MGRWALAPLAVSFLGTLPGPGSRAQWHRPGQVPAGITICRPGAATAPMGPSRRQRSRPCLSRAHAPGSSPGHGAPRNRGAPVHRQVGTRWTEGAVAHGKRVTAPRPRRAAWSRSTTASPVPAATPPTGLTCACITPPPQGSLRRPQKSRGHQGRVSISQGPGPLPGDRWPQEQVPLPGTPLPRLSQEPQEASRGLCHQEAEEGTQATGSPCRHRSARIPGVGVAQDLAGPPRITAAGPLLLARPGGIPLALGHLRLLHPCWRSRAGGCSPRPCPRPSASGGLALGEDQAVLPAQGGCQRPGSPLPSAVRTPAAWARPHAEEGSYQKGTHPKT